MDELFIAAGLRSDIESMWRMIANIKHIVAKIKQTSKKLTALFISKSLTMFYVRLPLLDRFIASQVADVDNF